MTIIIEKNIAIRKETIYERTRFSQPLSPKQLRDGGIYKPFIYFSLASSHTSEPMYCHQWSYSSL